MSFYTYKQPIRQEGFHLPPSPPPSNSNSTPPPSSSYDLFNTIPEYKPPAFSDELASLMSNERGSPGMYDDYTTQHQHQHQQRHTHNIFDISAPTSSMHNQLASSASSTASFPPSYNANSNNGANGANGAHSQPSSYHHPTPSTHFNSTLPALGSVRYEPERSRSRSRPPSGGDAVGPQRTVRSRRGGSVSSTSPPPGKPGAIVIPGQQQRGGQVGSPMSPGGTWFGSGSTSTPTTEYLPTPDSLHSHSLHHQHSSHQGYTPFSLPSPGGDMHLPPLAHHHKDMHRDIMSAPRDIMSSTGPRDIMSSPRDILHPHQHTSSSYGISPPLSSSLTGALSSLGPLSPLTSPITPSLMSSSIPVSSSLNHGVNGNGMTAQDKQALLANEKRRRRRESHNAVERRRRDNINEKISELATLIPECMLEGGTSTSPAPVALDPDTLVPPASANGAVPAAVASSAQDKKDEDADGGVVKANKGMILRKSVEYIRFVPSFPSNTPITYLNLKGICNNW
ncbi:helix-loop-helix DNA-binding domain-containing protein [Cyathus striatus]|nr:helix-loop-helix DNA-binding domain-containing protein [Cyathus striatus]